MKLLGTTIITFLVATGTFGAVQDSVNQPATVAKAVPELEFIWRMDSNQDGHLQRSEMPPQAITFVDSFVAAYDAEQAVNGATTSINLKTLDSLVKEHLQNSKPVTNPPQRRVTNRQALQYAAQLISLYDKNQDQFLSSPEFKQLSDKWIECDLNEDLRLDVVEVAAGLKYALNFPKNPDGSFDQNKSDKDHGELQKIHDAMKSESKSEPDKSKDRKPTGGPRQFAASLVATYDKNNNGSLESSELKQIGPSWVEVDFDNDGKATVDEIQVQFQKYEEQSLADNANGVSNSNRSSNAETLVSLEFQRLDTNRDGQIQMHEFATEFDASAVDDFYRHDASGDGVITPNEWNRFLAKQNQNALPPTEKSVGDRVR